MARTGDSHPPEKQRFRRIQLDTTKYAPDDPSSSIPAWLRVVLASSSDSSSHNDSSHVKLQILAHQSVPKQDDGAPATTTAASVFDSGSLSMDHSDDGGVPDAIHKCIRERRKGLRSTDGSPLLDTIDALVSVLTDRAKDDKNEPQTTFALLRGGSNDEHPCVNMEIRQRTQSGLLRRLWKVTLRFSSIDGSSIPDLFLESMVDDMDRQQEQIRKLRQSETSLKVKRDEWKLTADNLSGEWQVEKNSLVENFCTLYKQKQHKIQQLRDQVKQQERQLEGGRPRRSTGSSAQQKTLASLMANAPADGQDQDDLYDDDLVARLAAGPPARRIKKEATTTTRPKRRIIKKEPASTPKKAGVGAAAAADTKKRRRKEPSKETDKERDGESAAELCKKYNLDDSSSCDEDEKSKPKKASRKAPPVSDAAEADAKKRRPQETSKEPDNESVLDLIKKYNLDESSSSEEDEKLALKKKKPSVSSSSRTVIKKEQRDADGGSSSEEDEKPALKKKKPNANARRKVIKREQQDTDGSSDTCDDEDLFDPSVRNSVLAQLDEINQEEEDKRAVI